MLAFAPYGLHAQPTLDEAVDNTDLVWTTGGNVAWVGQTVVTHDGVDAAQCGFILDFQESWLQTALNGPGTLTFWWRVSSEADFDYLRFHIDGVLQLQISGEVNWQQRSLSIPEGSHALRWRYVKDANTANGQDRGWVDQVSFTAASGAPGIVMQPASQVAWEGGNVALSAVVLGTPPLTNQWYFNETNAIAGGTNRSLVFNNLLPDQAGSYRVVVSNAIGSATSSSATVALANNGPVTQVLLFVDSPVTSPFETALQNLGLPYQLFFDEFSFNAAVNSANRTTTLVIVDQPQNQYTFSSFTSFVNGGGRMLLQANTLAGSPNLAALLQVTIDVRSNNPQPVYDWGGSPLFTGLSSPLGLIEIGFDEDAQKLHAAPGAYGVAGFASSPTPGAAAVVIGRGGRTIVNGFWVEGASSSANATRFAENEILFLTGPVSATIPLIKVQPRSQTALVGTAVTLRVTAWGGLPLNYQWFFNQTNAIAGAVGSSYTRSSAQPADAGSYTVVMSNAFGSVTSSPALLTVATHVPVQNILLFADSWFYASPYETALLELGRPYQKSSSLSDFQTALAGANTLSTLLIIDAVDYTYDFTSVANHVNAGGRAILQYWNLGAGSLATAFKVSVGQALYTPPPVYNWGGSTFFTGLGSPVNFSDSFIVDGQRLQPMAGAQAVAGFVGTPTASQAAIVIGNSGRTIVNGIGLEESTVQAQGVQLARNEIAFLLAVPPTITAQPQSRSVACQANLTFSVTAGGTAPLTYRWRKDGVFISWGTNSSLTLANVQASDSGSYSVVVSNVAGSVTSDPALLTVLPEPPPPLSILVEGTNAVVTWPVPCVAYQLEHADTLESPKWSEVAGTPEVVNGKLRLLVPLSTGNYFFRLRN